MRLQSLVPSRETPALMQPGFGLFGLHREIDRLFNEFAQGAGADRGPAKLVPNIEISETDKDDRGESRDARPRTQGCRDIH